MSSILFVNVNKIYDNNVQAVFDFNLSVKDKEFIVFVGPSGCGKSTTLRMLAGLEEVTDGEIYIDEKMVNDVHPKDRDIAMVFQSYALYPHMSVYENMAFGLKIRGIPKPEIERRIQVAADILGLKPYLNRKPKALSGGQRQRVALGRAIVREPKVFLMDEPLSNLDAKLRVQMRGEIIKIHQRVGATTIYVTHDQTEAMTMADRIVVMRDGYIQQVGTPEYVYNNPANMFVAGFIGSPSMNFINCRYENGSVVVKDGFKFDLSEEEIKTHDEFYSSMLSKYEQQREELEIEVQKEDEELAKKPNKKKKGSDEPTKKEQLEKLVALVEKTKRIIAHEPHEVVVGIRPEDIYLMDDPAKENSSDSFEMKCDIAELLGREKIVYAEIKEGVRIAFKTPAKYNIQQNDRLSCVFNLKCIHLFDEDSTSNILLFNK